MSFLNMPSEKIRWIRWMIAWRDHRQLDIEKLFYTNSYLFSWKKLEKLSEICILIALFQHSASIGEYIYQIYKILSILNILIITILIINIIKHHNNYVVSRNKMLYFSSASILYFFAFIHIYLISSSCFWGSPLILFNFFCQIVTPLL